MTNKKQKTVKAKSLEDFVVRSNYTLSNINNFFDRREDLEVKIEGKTLLHYFQLKEKSDDLIYYFAGEEDYLLFGGTMKNDSILIEVRARKTYKKPEYI